MSKFWIVNNSAAKSIEIFAMDNSVRSGRTARKNPNFSSLLLFFGYELFIEKNEFQKGRQLWMVLTCDMLSIPKDYILYLTGLTNVIQLLIAKTSNTKYMSFSDMSKVRIHRKTKVSVINLFYLLRLDYHNLVVRSKPVLQNHKYCRSLDVETIPYVKTTRVKSVLRFKCTVILVLTIRADYLHIGVLLWNESQALNIHVWGEGKLNLSTKH